MPIDHQLEHDVLEETFQDHREVLLRRIDQQEMEYTESVKGYQIKVREV